MVKFTIEGKTIEVSASQWPQVKNTLDKYFEALSEFDMLSTVSGVIESRLVKSNPSITNQVTLSTQPKSSAITLLEKMPGFRPPTNKKIIDFATEAIRAIGTWATTDQIIVKMQSSGWTSTAKNARSLNSTVRNTLRESSRDINSLVIQYGNVWGLSEWLSGSVRDSETNKQSPNNEFEEFYEDIITVKDLFPDQPKNLEADNEDLDDPFAEYEGNEDITVNLQKSTLGERYGIGPNFGRTL